MPGTSKGAWLFYFSSEEAILQTDGVRVCMPLADAFRAYLVDIGMPGRKRSMAFSLFLPGDFARLFWSRPHHLRY